MKSFTDRGRLQNDRARAEVNANVKVPRSDKDHENENSRNVTDMYNFDLIPPFIRTKIESTVQKTIQQQKIFALGRSNYHTVKSTLTRRGWIQKYECEDIPSMKVVKKPNDLEELYTQSLLRGVSVNFIWTRIVPEWREIDPKTLVNRFPRVREREHFCTKIGLNNNLQNAYWFHQDGVSSVKFPRTYNLSSSDMISFIEDFVTTACIGLLKIVIGEQIEPTESYILFKADGKVPVDLIYYSIKKCDDYIIFREHGDLDKHQDSKAINPTVNELMNMYKCYLTNFYKIADQKDSFEEVSRLEFKKLYNACKSILQCIEKFWPQIDLDGYKNLWIVKESDLSCGVGVKIVRELTDIVAIVQNKNEAMPCQHVVQKYIERPMLIHSTKFDIRQWFLLTRVNPLQIWMYRCCYLRFSSQPFSLDDTHESVHLCNNSVQKKYKVNPDRHPDLPDCNMWDSTTFREYLECIGEGDKWAKVIYPGMRASIIATIQSSQEDLIDRSNSFELFGADFMLTEDFSPWLIEINSSPAMHASTSVTRKLCWQGFRDVIRVVIDSKKSRKVETGYFELIYTQDLFYKQVVPQMYSSGLTTYGTQLKIIKIDRQIGSLPIMDLLKVKKWKNLTSQSSEDDILHTIRKNFLQKQKFLTENKLKNTRRVLAIENKAISTTSINKKINQRSILKDNNNSNMKEQNQPVGDLIRAFLRSSHKIKYILLPQIIPVDTIYFQVHERNTGENGMVEEHVAEFNLSSNLCDNDLEESEINSMGLAVEADCNSNNDFKLRDSCLGNPVMNQTSQREIRTTENTDIMKLKLSNFKESVLKHSSITEEDISLKIQNVEIDSHENEVKDMSDEKEIDHISLDLYETNKSTNLKEQSTVIPKYTNAFPVLVSNEENRYHAFDNYSDLKKHDSDLNREICDTIVEVGSTSNSKNYILLIKRKNTNKFERNRVEGGNRSTEDLNQRHLEAIRQDQVNIDYICRLLNQILKRGEFNAFNRPRRPIAQPLRFITHPIDMVNEETRGITDQAARQIERNKTSCDALCVSTSTIEPTISPSTVQDNRVHRCWNFLTIVILIAFLFLLSRYLELFEYLYSI